MTELQDTNSNSSLCNICCGADFPGMFTGRDSHDGFNCYRADLSFEKQVPRTWAHIKTNAKSCAFCELTFRQIQSFRLITRNWNCLRVPEPFPDARADDMVIAVVEIVTGMFGGVFTQCIGFHNDTYWDPSHESLMVRGLQLCALERSRGPQWKRAYQEMEQAKDALRWGPDGYAALSYVWGGGIPGTQLKTTNELMLRQPGSLSAPSIVLGGTITDAMEFCRRIGLRLLWVDQLCIPQRQDSIDPEIHQMASIYSGATCTLVALSGTTFADPLPGVRSGTRHPEVQHQATVDGLKLMTCYPSLVTEIESSVWFSRGWTFQEAAFSKRNFFFTASQIFFLCRETVYYEESVWELPGGSAFAKWADTKTIEAGRIKDLMLLHNSNGSYQEGIYYRIVEEYTKRTLGHPEDILNAWAAVVQWMVEDEKWGSACSFGLPLDQFGFGLGWQPLQGHDPDPSHYREGFPSWSWTSFQGPIKWGLGVPSGACTGVGDRESAWGRSGIIQETDIDIALRERYHIYVSPVRMSQSTLTPQDRILEFKTSSAHITVAQEPNPAIKLPTFDMIGSNGELVGSLQCDPGWRAKQPAKLEFIVFAAAKLTPLESSQYIRHTARRYKAAMSGRLSSNRDSYEAAVSAWRDLLSRERFELDLMCISRGSEGLVRRVQVCHGISLDQWLSQDPKEVMVKLG